MTPIIPILFYHGRKQWEYGFPIGHIFADYWVVFWCINRTAQVASL
ncbi:Rpn family recombination-promoting nuclease/putative transposase [Parapedobacter sp. ISTM3]|nr:Rpn family recombination-promoting nuclease/putative transposase [Parapedobacter sp. ISTM3]